MVMTSPLRSAATISPAWRPDRRSTAPFWLVSNDRARAGANRDARASSAVDAINIGRPSDVADRTNKIGRCAAEGKTITHSADRERIAPAMKHQRAASGRAANDKAGLDNVEADAAAGGVGGGGEPGAGHGQSNQHGTNGR